MPFNRPWINYITQREFMMPINVTLNDDPPPRPHRSPQPWEVSVGTAPCAIGVRVDTTQEPEPVCPVCFGSMHGCLYACNTCWTAMPPDQRNNLRREVDLRRVAVAAQANIEREFALRQVADPMQASQQIKGNPMHKKDYQLVARVLSECRQYAPYGAQKELLRSIIIKFNTAFSQTNVSYDPQAFLEACEAEECDWDEERARQAGSVPNTMRRYVSAATGWQTNPPSRPTYTLPRPRMVAVHELAAREDHQPANTSAEPVGVPSHSLDTYAERFSQAMVRLDAQSAQPPQELVEQYVEEIAERYQPISTPLSDAVLIQSEALERLARTPFPTPRSVLRDDPGEL